jgi:hypothetical protein
MAEKRESETCGFRPTVHVEKCERTAYKMQLGHSELYKPFHFWRICLWFNPNICVNKYLVWCFATYYESKPQFCDCEETGRELFLDISSCQLS